MNLKTLTIVTLSAGMLVLGGCASTQDIEKLRAEVEQANATANAAAADAAEAKRLAAEAKAQSEETEDKINRMFKKAMYK